MYKSITSHKTSVPIIDHYSSTSLYSAKTIITLDMADVSDKCISSGLTVTSRQQAIQCDGCFNWNHRTCNTGKLNLRSYIMFLNNIPAVMTYKVVLHVLQHPFETPLEAGEALISLG